MYIRKNPPKREITPNGARDSAIFVTRNVEIRMIGRSVRRGAAAILIPSRAPWRIVWERTMARSGPGENPADSPSTTPAPRKKINQSGSPFAFPAGEKKTGTQPELAKPLKPLQVAPGIEPGIKDLPFVEILDSIDEGNASRKDEVRSPSTCLLHSPRPAHLWRP